MMTLYVLGAFAAVLSLLAFVVSREANRWITVLGLVLAGGFLAVGWGQTTEAFGGMYRLDTLGRTLSLVAILGGLWTLLLGPAKKFEYPLLVLYAVAGMHIMATTPNLVVMLIALEVFSLPLYVLATWQRDERGFESGLKYFLLGALAAAVFLYGTALYFGATGSFNAGAVGSGPLYLAGLMLLMAGLAFKVSMVPFQWWTPDVYQGSPTVVTLFMATAVKAAAFAAMLRIFTPQGLEAWGMGLAILIALTTVFGNLGALSQTEAKRLFAYSSIAHAGYMGLGLYGAGGQSAIPFYLLVYGLATGIIFAVLSMLSNQDVPLSRLKGLWSRRPLWAGAMGLSLISLLGLPPLAGFWGKFLVFQEAAKAGYYPLLVLALVTSAISAYYYLKVFFSLFAKPDLEAAALDAEAEAAVARFGSSEAAGPVVGAPMGLSQALMAPTARVGMAPWLLLAALALLGLLSFFPRLALDPFKLGLPTAAAATQVPATPVTPAGSLGFLAPPMGSSVDPKGFELSGTAAPGQVLELYEDGVSLGRVSADANGQWKLLVPPPLPGSRTYQIRAEGATDGPTWTLTVPEAQAGTCTESFSLSNLQDGAVLSKPFRFGGVGSASSYTVTVKRGERIIGTKPLPLSAACGWSYLSNPGTGAITYEVRETMAAPDSPPLTTINLTIQ